MFFLCLVTLLTAFWPPRWPQIENVQLCKLLGHLIVEWVFLIKLWSRSSRWGPTRAFVFTRGFGLRIWKLAWIFGSARLKLISGQILSHSKVKCLQFPLIMIQWILTFYIKICNIRIFGLPLVRTKLLTPVRKTVTTHLCTSFCIQLFCIFVLPSMFQF